MIHESARLRAIVATLAMAAFAAAAGGCSLVPFRGSPETPPGTVAADSSGIPPGDAASGESAPGEAAEPGTAGAEEDSLARADSAGDPTKSETTAPTSPPPAEPAPPPAPDPDASDQVTVQISDAERAELEARARESLKEARRVIRTIDRTTLSAERLEKLAAAETLMDQARASFDDDVRAAAALAHKASVLLAELTAN